MAKIKGGVAYGYEEIEEIFKDNKEGINDLEGRMEYNRSMFQVRI